MRAKSCLSNMPQYKHSSASAVASPPGSSGSTPSRHVHGQKVTGRGGCDGTRLSCCCQTDPAARHWIQQRTAAGAAAVVRAGCFLFRRYCSFKTRPRRVCGSRSVKNRVRALALQEAAVTAAPCSREQPSAGCTGPQPRSFRSRKTYKVFLHF